MDFSNSVIPSTFISWELSVKRNFSSLIRVIGHPEMQIELERQDAYSKARCLLKCKILTHFP